MNLQIDTTTLRCHCRIPVTSSAPSAISLEKVLWRHHQSSPSSIDPGISFLLSTFFYLYDYTRTSVCRFCVARMILSYLQRGLPYPVQMTLAHQSCRPNPITPHVLAITPAPSLNFQSNVSTWIYHFLFPQINNKTP